MLRVAGAVIEADGPRDTGGICLEGFAWEPGRVLIARRRPEKIHGGKWELPGGKLEDGESAAACLVRELAEELGIAVSVGAWVATNEHDYGRGPLALEAWRCTWESGVLVPIDHDAVAWVAPDALLDFDLAEADVPLARAITSGSPGRRRPALAEEPPDVVHFREPDGRPAASRRGSDDST